MPGAVLPLRPPTTVCDNVPSRDLYVSPDHALLIDGVLVNAAALLNGTTIARATDVPAIFTYYHVELHDHSLILAENTPAETFIDNVHRMAFDNWAEHEALYPDAAPPIPEMAYPRAKAARQVTPAMRERIATRAEALAAPALEAA
jgi:Hint domain